MKISDCQGCRSLSKRSCTLAKAGHRRINDPDKKVYFGNPCQITWLLECPKNLKLTDPQKKKLGELKKKYRKGRVEFHSTGTYGCDT